MRPFEKPATMYAQQVELLRSRGLLIADAGEAEFYLQHLNYYRLGAYWLPFEADHATHKFRAGTQFSDVLNLYQFDRELRLLVLDAVERVEVSVRAQWAYQLAHRHGAHAHLDSANAMSEVRWAKDLAALTREVERSDERFISHIKATYSESLPAVWAVCEVMSIGILSRWYANMRPMATRRAIAGVYRLDQRVLESWLHHLSYLRNICAHHSRLWNREFTVTPSPPKTKPSTLVDQFNIGSRKPYNSFLILLCFLDVASPNHDWRQRLQGLLEKHLIPTSDMGFPDGWRELPIWQEPAL